MFLALAYYVDSSSVSVLTAQVDPTFNTNVLDSLDNDVKEERSRVQQSDIADPNIPLTISSLRKVFPPKHENGAPLVAVEDISFNVQKGEIFGLLGANG